MIEPLASVFQVCPLGAEAWVITALLALMPLPLVELEKYTDKIAAEKMEKKTAVTE